MNIVKDKIREKIYDDAIIDSEIIQDIESVKKHFGFYLDINYGKYPEGYSLLMGAVLWNRKELVRYLLTYPNININKMNDKAFTSLIFACCKGNVPILELFLCREELDINIQDNAGWTGLHWACYYGYEMGMKCV